MEQKQKIVEILIAAANEFTSIAADYIMKVANGEIPAEEIITFDTAERRAEFYAERLIENGAIVPPCKVGTKVVVITSQTSNGKNLYIFEDTITHYRICDGVTIMCLENHLGVAHWEWKNVFFSENAREAAEQALAEKEVTE